MEHGPFAVIAETIGRYLGLVFDFLHGLLSTVTAPIREGLKILADSVGLADSDVFYWIVLACGILLLAASLRAFWRHRTALAVGQMAIGGLLVAAFAL